MKRIALVVVSVVIVGLLAGAVAITVVGGAQALRRAGAEPVAAASGGGEGGPRGGGEARVLAPSTKPIPGWETLSGTIVVGSAGESDIAILLSDGSEIEVGTGPGWLDTQGFVLEPGDAVTVRGYWEDGEFKAGEITRQRDGATIALRDESGHPAWAGQGKGKNRVGNESPGGAGAGSGTGSGWGRNRKS